MPLPPGLILNRATGEVTGTPTQAGTYDVQVVVRDALGTERSISQEIVINAYTPMVWSGSFGNMMATRAPAQNTVSMAGGQAPISFEVFSGALPDGLSLNPSTGAITGTPTTAGNYSLTLRSTDAITQTKDYVISGSVIENLTLSHNAGAGFCTVGVSKTIPAPTRAGGTASFAYSLPTGQLPPGLSLNTSTGVISGTPTGSSAEYTGLKLRVTDALGFTADTATFTLTVTNAPALSGSLDRGTAGTAYSDSYSAGAGHTPYTWSATGLPTGLSIDDETGVVSGTPTTPGSYTPTVTLVDSAGNLTRASNTVTIAAEVSLTGSPSDGVKGVPYSFQPTVSGGWTPYVFSISAGALPAGLALNASTGRITGTPQAQSANTATLQVVDADGNSDTLAVDIDIAGDISITGDIPAIGTTGVAFTGDDLGTTGGSGAQTWSVSSGALPTGLTLNTSTGDITGTPSAAGTFSFTIKVIDAAQSYSFRSDSITIANPVELSGTLPDHTVGFAYSASYTRTGGHAPFAYSMFAGSLPDGLSLDANTGVISGTPTVVDTFSFTIKVVDADGNIWTRGQNLAIYTPPDITGGYTLEAERTIAYSSSGVSATGGKTPRSFAISSGTLPAGLTLNGGTGAITGTPTAAAGTYGFTVRVTDALGRTDSLSDSIILREKVVLLNGAEEKATRGKAYSDSFVAQYGWTPYTYAHISGTMPPGLALNTSTGAITGTPTTDGTYDFIIRAIDDIGATANLSDRITVKAPVTLTGTPAAGTRNVAYGFTPGGVNGWGPHTFTIISGSIPAGCTLNSSTGAITGTPSTAATYNFTMRKKDANNAATTGSHDDTAFSIVIAVPPTISGTAGRGMVGKAYSADFNGSGGHTPYSFSIPSGSLPAGTSLTPSTGVVAGTPNTAGTYNFTARLTDAKGNTSSSSQSVAIAAALVINGSFANGTKNDSYSSSVTASGGWAPRTFTKVSGTLPSGLSLSAGGVLSGTPTAAGTFSFTVRVTDADGATKDKAMSVTIVNPLVFRLTASPNPAYGSAFSNGQDVTASAGITVTPVDNTGSVTYTWTQLTDGLMTVTASGTQMLGSKTGKLNSIATERWRCTGRDTVTGATATVDCEMTLEIYDTR